MRLLMNSFSCIVRSRVLLWAKVLNQYNRDNYYDHNTNDSAHRGQYDLESQAEARGGLVGGRGISDEHVLKLFHCEHLCDLWDVFGDVRNFDIRVCLIFELNIDCIRVVRLEQAPAGRF